MSETPMPYAVSEVFRKTRERLEAATSAVQRLGESCERGSDSLIAFARKSDAWLRKSEDALTTEQRLRYYELRDMGVLPVDALVEVTRH